MDAIFQLLIPLVMADIVDIGIANADTNFIVRKGVLMVAMAIGLGRMLGFEFLENFNYPYISKSVTEFWRRWHISLSTWFRDYVYIPLGGNRKGLRRQLLNIVIVWALTGMWHGANWTFLVWGLYYALFLVLEKAFLLKVLERTPGVIRRLYTMTEVKPPSIQSRQSS